MEKNVKVVHVSRSSPGSFEAFLKAFEAQLGRHDPSAYENLLANPNCKTEVEKVLKGQEGTSGFMIFSTYDHGGLLQIKGGARKARQYIIGNPLFASEMTKYDIRSALYAPLRVLLYSEKPGTVTVEYDLASSLFGQFENENVNATARDLDVKMAALLEKSFAAIGPIESKSA